MTVYEVYDCDVHGDYGRYYRNLKEAKSDFVGVKCGRLTKITIPMPITKETVVALLNHEGFAIEQEEIEVRN